MATRTTTDPLGGWANLQLVQSQSALEQGLWILSSNERSHDLCPHDPIDAPSFSPFL